ncbi:DNA-3-methyladenine glycosylase I [Spongiibacter sp. KMU-166]|uniref:DNA-3-methyladenine glycosylase I n=1 Tax=Spongiibacter thalassae TaxID=2721624 RepID=A0ABX1GEQ4_9GAMM|nr:DNA-3-methyladenine glycosylase I [Spongiibacter thalassae]NKI17680.1 DNA-3-methyladenine glycosylase I [Spongiibacter thalassae]
MISLYTRYLERAIAQHGSLEAVEDKLPKAKTARQLQALGDDRYLAEMAACIFRAGFVWRVVENKWDGFETVFNNFLPIWVASRSPEDIEQMATDTRIIRNLSKVRAVQDNALFVLDIQREYGSFGKFLAQWPAQDIVDLWLMLKKRGSRLGGASGQYFLRFVGKDTFILSRDVCVALKAEGIVDRDQPTAKRDLLKIQQAFNAMADESGRSLGELSMILALSTGPR